MLFVNPTIPPHTGPAIYAIKKVPIESHQIGNVSLSAITLPSRSTASAAIVHKMILYSFLFFICIPSYYSFSSYTIHKATQMMSGSKARAMMPADCSVLCTPTILPNIRISWD